jgi:hypothetical protein
MNKLVTIALAATISLFLTTSVVAQEKSNRRHKGAEHSKKAHAEKSVTNKACKCEVCKCVCACHKSKAKALTPKRRGDARRGRGARGRTEGRGRTDGRGRGLRRLDRGDNPGEAGRKRFDELLKLYRERAKAGRA